MSAEPPRPGDVFRPAAAAAAAATTEALRAHVNIACSRLGNQSQYWSKTFLTFPAYTVLSRGQQGLADLSPPPAVSDVRVALSTGAFVLAMFPGPEGNSISVASSVKPRRATDVGSSRAISFVEAWIEMAA